LEIFLLITSHSIARGELSSPDLIFLVVKQTTYNSRFVLLSLIAIPDFFCCFSNIFNCRSLSFISCFFAFLTSAGSLGLI
jgi:hypothetical protein